MWQQFALYRDQQKSIDSIFDALKEGLSEATLMFPTFNWDFCQNKPFDYRNSEGKTGLLGNYALKRNDFKRTRHPIYSFAVSGKYANELLNLDNKSSFGSDSPFGKLYDYNGKIVMIDTNLQRSFTYAHFIEQKYGVNYRYEKEFCAPYIDENGNQTQRCYTMFVRDLDLGVITHLEPLERVLIREGVIKVYTFGRVNIKVLDARLMYDRVVNELQRNPHFIIRFEKDIPYTQGQAMHSLAKELYPINRSLSGEGVRETLAILQRENPELKIHAIQSGTEVFDWSVPKEWNCKEAYIITPDGQKICDYSKNNLHLMQYSIPFNGEMELEELQKHLYSYNPLPDAIPYVTSYYKERWGFCISSNERKKLKKGRYKVFIDSTLEDGVLNYGDILIPGKTDQEVMFSTYICHPSMANNELSGPILATYLAKYIKQLDNHYTYRFVFAPETIGSLIYLHNRLDHLKRNLKAGFVLTCVGDEKDHSYLASRYGDTLADKVALHTLKHHAPSFTKYTFLDRGSDERQYCAPEIDLPFCSVMRTKYGKYPQYHTSLDNLDLITPKGLQGAYDIYAKIIDTLEQNFYYKIQVLGEPQLGKRGLYPTMTKTDTDYTQAFLYRNFLAYADGSNDLVDIAEIIGAKATDLIDVAKIMLKHRIVEKL